MSYTARLIALALVLNATMGGVVFKSLSDSRNESERDAAVTTQNVSRLVSEELEGDFNLADAALRVVTDEVDLQTATGKPSKAPIEAAMQRLLQRNPTLLNFVVTDRKGDLIYGLDNGKAQSALNVGDRAYFNTLRDKPQIGLVVSDLVNSKIDGKSVMVLARRLNDKSGAFMGVALVSYDVEAMQRKLEAYSLGGKATITVRSEQLALMVRHPPGTLAVTSSGATRVSNTFSLALQKHPLSGTYSVGRDSIDGVPRLHSYTKSKKYPFYVNVGIAKSDYLAAWETEVQNTVALYLVFALTTVFGIVLLHKAWKRKEETELELQVQRDRLQQVVTGSALGTWHWNLSTKEVNFNARMAEIAGLTAQEISPATETTWTTLRHPDDGDRYHEAIRRCLKKETDDFQCETRVRHKDGRWIWVLDRGQVVERAPDGKVVTMSGTRQDISERVSAEERQIYAVLDAAPDGALLVDKAGNILYANPKSAGIFGCQTVDLIHSQIETLVPVAQREKHVELRSKFTRHAGSRGMGMQSEVQGLRRDGTAFPVEVKLNPFVMNYESVVIASITDITQRLATERSISESEVKLRKAQDIGNLGSYSLNLETGVWESSPQLDRIFGIDYGFVRDVQGWNSLVHPNYSKLALDHFMDVVRERKDFRLDYEIVRPLDGKIRWVAGNGELEYADDGTPKRLIGTIQDITDRKATEQQLRVANETLEERVAQRTGELVDALAAAEHAKQSRGEFLAKMSHEIRTPMNAVLGLVYLALQKQPAPDIKPFLEKIRQSSQHLLGIINDILDFTKIDAGKLELESGVIDIEQVVQHVVLLTEGKGTEKGLAVTSSVAENVPRKLQGDSLRIAQILINYVNNAIKFTERGGVSIHVLCLPTDESDGRKLVCFEVRDTGIGVSAEQHSRLFQDFEQADNSITRRFGGTGLGLSISKQLATLMGGEVGVNSTPGIGSTFWFTARLVPAGEVATAADTFATQDMPALLAALRGKHVLVVDDNSLNLEVAQGVLEGAGIHVAQACDGALALDILRTGTFDCVLMDVHMPVMDGLEATRRLRADPALARIPVLAMTANSRREDHMECLQAGMNDVVMKPFDPDQLFIALARWTGVGKPLAALDPAQTLSVAVAPSAVKSPAPVSVDELPEWDITYLQRVVGNNTATQRRLLEKFQVSARELVPAVDLAVATQRWAEAREQAHKLKSSARAVGAMRLGAFCQAMEDAGKAEQAQECRLLATAMTDALASVDEKITSYLATA